MKPAPRLSNEEVRLSTLRKYRVLDTQYEQVFDDITRLAASICKTPIALVSLVDADRQWFKSRHGLEAIETPRDVSFCGHAIHEVDIFEIRDAFADPRFADNPLVTGKPNVRFYAGAPLLAPNGLALGTLCVIDHAPKELSMDQKESLRVLARHVVGLMELRISADGATSANAKLVGVQKHLEENRRLLNNVLDSLPNLISYMDCNLNYRYVNSTYESWFGLKLEDIVGRSMSDVLGEKVVALVQDKIDLVLRGQRIEFELTVPYKHGGTRDIHVTYLPDLLPDGRIDGFIAVVRDTSESNRNHQLIFDQQSLLDAIIQQVPSAIVLKDAQELKYTLWNKSAEQILMRPASEALGKTVFDLYPTEQAKQYEKWDREALKDGKLIDIAEVQSTIPEKGDIVVRTRKVAISPDSNGAYRYLLTVMEDVTEEKRIRDELIFAHEEAMAATKSKAEFLANMSHEIRTPMNGVIGMTNLLLGDALTAEQTQRLKIIQNCGNSLLDLINDVLDFSKLEAGKVELETEPFDVVATTQEILELFKGRASEKGVTLSFSPSPTTPRWITGDTTRFRQILTNLVSNAIKFTDNGRIDVGSEAKTLGSKTFQILFSVKDSGVGIPDDVKKKLFASFSQADASTTRRFGGTGLGLAICKGLCEKMGGTIWVDSVPGKGSTFSFSFVAARSEAPKQASTANPFAMLDSKSAEKSPLRILVVEDNRTNQLVAAGLLSRLGYHADIAGNGREALECTANQRYDLILMDCHMPVMDGFEATRRILARAQAPHPRIVALTASMMTEDLARCRQCGMAGFLGKPISIASLVNVLEECKSGSNASEHTTAQGLMPASIRRAFDRQTYLANFQGMEDLAKETIQTFVRTLPKAVAAIELAIANKSAADLAFSAHSLRGAVSNFFTETAEQLAERLEELAHAGSTDGAAELLVQLKTELETLSSELQSLLKEHPLA